QRLSLWFCDGPPNGVKRLGSPLPVLARTWGGAAPKWKLCFALSVCPVAFISAGPIAGPILEEGFNYPVGSSLSGNSPWSGSAGTSLSIGAENLSSFGLRD